MESALRIGGSHTGLTLFETMRWDGGKAPLWPRHAARFRASILRLGWQMPAISGPKGPDHPARLRLSLRKEDEPRWEVFRLPPDKPVWRVVLSDQRLQSNDPWLGVKTSNRFTHDAVRATLAQDVDEAIFANERDEICEGTITNVFFDRGDGLRTPPLASGLLPGVLRAEIAAPEEILLIEDLAHVKLWIGNALRGLIPVEFQPKA